MTVAPALLGLATMIMPSLNERRRDGEPALGARPRTIFRLLVTEASSISLARVLLGVIVVYAGPFALRPVIDSVFGCYLTVEPPSGREITVLGAVVGRRCPSVVPAVRAYRMSLAGGISVRI